MKRFLTVLIFISVALGAQAIPIPATDPVDIKGTVSSFAWIDQTFFRYEGDDFNLSSAGAPARYLVILDTESLTAKERAYLSGTAIIDSFTGLSHPIIAVKLKKSQILVQITAPLIKELIRGATIELKQYSLSGDEFGTDETFAALHIDGKPIKIKKAEQGSAR